MERLYRPDHSLRLLSRTRIALDGSARINFQAMLTGDFEQLIVKVSRVAARICVVWPGFSLSFPYSTLSVAGSCSLCTPVAHRPADDRSQRRG